MHNDSFKEALNYLENHPGIVRIKRKGSDASFNFRDTNSDEVIKLIKTLNIIKDCQKNYDSTKVINVNADLFANYVFRNFNYSVEKGKFLCALKHAEVVPVHEKKERKDKANYRPVCTLFFIGTRKIDCRLNVLIFQQSPTLKTFLFCFDL